MRASLAVLAWDALGANASAAPGDTEVSLDGVDSSVRMIAAYLLKYAPPAGVFTANGAWRTNYDLLEWDGSPKRKDRKLGNRVVGHCSVTRRPATFGNGCVYELDHAIKLNGFESTLKSSMRCAGGVLPSLVDWETTYESHPVVTTGNPLRLSEKGVCGGGSLSIASGVKPRVIRTNRPVLPQWAVIDALRGNPLAPAAPPLNTEFDLLHNLTSYRPRQRLKACGALELTLAGKPFQLHGYLQTGAGTEPTHYWVDTLGRPLFVTAGLLSSALTSVEAA